LSDDWVGLADAVRALRSELTAAVKAGQNETIRFELGTVEMEFLVEIRKEGEGQLGLQFGVISVGGKGAVSSGNTHRLKLELSPRVKGRAPEILDIEPPAGQFDTNE
jgi:Trypsin-co-occurring domain 2